MYPIRTFLALVFTLLFILPNLGFAKEGDNLMHEVPQNIQEYVTQHFPQLGIEKYQVSMKRGVKRYEVKLIDRTKLKFDADLNIYKIDSDFALPETTLPASITAYVKTHYPENHIREWKRKYHSQEVELDSDIDLIFSLEGEFIRIDD